MGQYYLNTRVFCDYATPDNHTAFEFHMELPTPYEDFRKAQEWLEDGKWEAAGDYLTERYSQHGALINIWLSGSRSRSSGEDEKRKLAA
ncbi:MAG: hypothetical protein V6Z86_08705 [Hyphomicrobiales bacterium]